MPFTQHLVLVLTATATALIAGLFYAYSCSVNPGLHRLPDAGYLSAMQSINRAILNPVFFMSFLGTALLLPLCTALHFRQPLSPRCWLLLAASVLYLVGVFGVTIARNVPLNNQLDAFNISSASAEALAVQRTAFEGPWNRWNLIRTVASVLTIILVIIACLSPHRLPQPE